MNYILNERDSFFKICKLKSFNTYTLIVKIQSFLKPFSYFSNFLSNHMFKLMKNDIN